MITLMQITFACLVYPLLVFCYAGQAAYISKHLHASEDFNHLSKSVPGKLFHCFQFGLLATTHGILNPDSWKNANPEHLGHVFIFLSLLASVIGSQATITASFSIIKQCLALGCFPRVKVVHTSNNLHGQVYIPDVNWLLMVLSLTVTIGFHDLHRIATSVGMLSFHRLLCFFSLILGLFFL